MINDTNTNNGTSNNRTKFFISLENGETCQFTPTTMFNKVDENQVIGIMHNAEPATCKPNNKGIVNIKMIASNRIIGFINYLNTGLDANSNEAEITEAMASVKDLLSTVTEGDVALPLQEDEASDILAELTA